MLKPVTFKCKSHIAFILLFVVLSSYLTLKTLPEESWDGWGRGLFAAQTMLTLEHWTSDGIIHHKLLYIPIGYSPVVPLLDEPEMRHHARGAVTGRLVGRRLYYTHFPSGYVMPYAFLMKAGFVKRHWFRLLSVAFSMAALVLMYFSFNLVSGPVVAFASALYYGASTMFLDYADSMNNQAVDDVLRFAVVLASLAAMRRITDAGFRRYTALVWVLYFMLAVSSYDSTPFVFVWLVLLDVIFRSAHRERCGSALPWKRWVFFASAPVLAFALQVLQNWWYLGLNDMLLDFKGAFAERSTLVKASRGFLADHGGSAVRALSSMTAGASLAVVAITMSALVYLWLRRGSRGGPVAALSFIAAFLAAGSAFPLVFSNTAFFVYEGRQFAPFAALLAGSATVVLAGSLYEMRKRAGRTLGRAALVAVLLPCLSFVWYAQAVRTVDYLGEWPNNAVNVRWVEHIKRIGSLVEGNPVLFELVEESPVDYPQPSPIDEYYLGGTILSFKNPEDLLHDLYWLRRHSREPFDALIVSWDYEILRRMAASIGVPYDVEVIDESFILRVPARR